MPKSSETVQINIKDITKNVIKDVTKNKRFWKIVKPFFTKRTKTVITGNNHTVREDHYGKENYSFNLIIIIIGSTTVGQIA